MARRIGILGGTFDPIHIGHLRAALEVVEYMGLDEMRLLPNARPPHRGAPQVQPEQRLDMVRLAVSDVSGLAVDDRELRREGASYSIDTLESLRLELAADDQLFLLLGWDAFCGLPSWHRWQELLSHCHILVLQRPDDDSEAPQELQDLLAARAAGDPNLLQTPAGNIGFIWQTPLAISATAIREHLAHGRSVRFLVPDPVLGYIQTHRLYAASEH